MKIYKTLFLGLGLIALSSCSDFLNQTSPSELDNESTFNNAEGSVAEHTRMVLEALQQSSAYHSLSTLE